MTRSEAARRLARRVAFAARVDPVLLRRARLELVPEAGPDAEADVWSLPEVRDATASGLTFSTDGAQALRRELAEEGAEAYEAAWAITRECHRALSPALRLEEEVSYLDGSRRPEAGERIRALVRSALAALVSGDRRGLARWAARALPRFPDAVRRLEEVRMLGAASRARLPGVLGAPGTGLGAAADLTAWLAPVARVTMGVRLFPGVLEVRPAAAGGPPAPGLHEIELPATDPLVLEVVAGREDSPDPSRAPASTDAEPAGGESADDATAAPDRGRWTLRFRLHEVRRLRVPEGPLRLRSVLGEEYLVEPAAAAPGVLDFTSELAEHQPFVGRREEIAAIERPLSAGPGGWILVVGEPGSGKTALLAELVRSRDPRPPHHFFRGDLPAWASLETAVGSLAAQTERLMPELPAAAPRDLSSLLESWGRLQTLLGDSVAEGAPRPRPALVLDGLDAARRQPGATIDDLLPRTLPRGVSGIVSLERGSELVEWFEGGGQVVQRLELRLLDDLAGIFWAVLETFEPGARKRRATSAAAIEGRLRVLAEPGLYGTILAGPEAARFLAEAVQTLELDPTLAAEDWEHDLVKWLLTLDAAARPASKGSGAPASPARRAVGVLAAAREAIPEPLLETLTGGSGLEPGANPLLRRFASLGADGEAVWALRSPGVRRVVLHALGEEIRSEHQVLLGSLAAWPVREASPLPGRHDFALRHALYHAIGAGNLEQAGRLATDCAYLEARCRAGVDDLTRDLEELRDTLDRELATGREASASA